MTTSAMAEVVMYTRTYCGYCARAKALLEDKQVSFEEINLDAAPQRRAEMIQRAQGRSTVPQIFIDGSPIGGCDDLFALESRGELDGLLGNNG